MPPLDQIQGAYETAKALCAEDLKSGAARDAIRKLSLLSLKFLLSQSAPINLKSQVPGKQYISFKINTTVARPANSKYFVGDYDRLNDLWNQWNSGSIEPTNLSKLTYTASLAPCLAMELFDRQNKKGPATYFECFIGHIFARALNQNPNKRASLTVGGCSVKLTMDFLFSGQGNDPHLHLPVKMSTRERVVQAWAHQKILDSAFGENSYRGIMVLFSETKLNSKNLEVVEICVPDQWLAYQKYLSKMYRIYYFDLPQRYQSLTEEFPEDIQIKPFTEFFNEIAAIVSA
jgi:hypothetical protein